MKSTLQLYLEFDDIHEVNRRAALAARLNDVAVLVRNGNCSAALFDVSNIKAAGAFLVEHIDPFAEEPS